MSTHAPEIQALAYAINFAIGAVGSTVTFHEVPAQVRFESNQIERLRISDPDVSRHGVNRQVKEVCADTAVVVEHLT